MRYFLPNITIHKCAIYCLSFSAFWLLLALLAASVYELAFMRCCICKLTSNILVIKSDMFASQFEMNFQPERVASNDCEYGVRADVWSLGITLIELATGFHPYDGCSTDFELLTKIKNDPPPRLDPALQFSAIFSVFIARCLMKRPIDRPSYHELLVSRAPFLILFLMYVLQKDWSVVIQTLVLLFRI